MNTHIPRAAIVAVGVIGGLVAVELAIGIAVIL